MDRLILRRRGELGSEEKQHGENLKSWPANSSRFAASAMDDHNILIGFKAEGRFPNRP